MYEPYHIKYEGTATSARIRADSTETYVIVGCDAYIEPWEAVYSSKVPLANREHGWYRQFANKQRYQR